MQRELHKPVEHRATKGNQVCCLKLSESLTLFRVGFFQHPHISYNNETWHTFYLKKIQKIYESRDMPFEFCWHQHFWLEIIKFYYIKKYRYRLHFDTYFLILLTFLETLKLFLNKHGYNFDDVSKNSYLK